MLNKLISIASASLFASVAQAHWADITSPKDIKVIEVKPCETITVDYTLGAPDGNGVIEQRFEAFEVPSKNIEEAYDPMMRWYANEEIGKIPFEASVTKGQESRFYAFVYHSWSPTGEFWSQGSLSSVKLVSTNPKILLIKYRKGGSKTPALWFTKTVQPDCQ